MCRARIVAYVGQQAIGQGHETTFPLLLSRHLGVPAEAVELVQGDTERLPPRGAATGGSASLQCSGTTLLRAADRLVDKLRPHAADALEAASEDIRFGFGRYGVPGTDVGVGLLELGASLAGNPHTAGDCSARADFEGNGSTIPNGAYACEVEVDPDTGAVELQRFVGVNDVGQRIDPTIVDGQLHGGVAQGVGQAWLEHVRYDDGSGQLLSGTLMDYALPRADHFPDIELHRADIPTANNPIGAKGVGELGCVGAPCGLHERGRRRRRYPGDRNARHPGKGVAGTASDMTVNDTRIDFAEQSMSACNRATIHSRNRNFCTFPDAVIENVSTTSIRSGHLGFARPASWRTPRTVPATVAVIDCCYA